MRSVRASCWNGRRLPTARSPSHGGSSYRVLVLPLVETMTPELLAKIGELVRAGLTVIGTPPVKSPSLVGFPQCDETGEVPRRRTSGEAAKRPRR